MAPKKGKKKPRGLDPGLQQRLRILGCERICVACYMAHWEDYLDESLVDNICYIETCQPISDNTVPNWINLRKDMCALEAVSKDCSCDAESFKLMDLLSEEDQRALLRK